MTRRGRGRGRGRRPPRRGRGYLFTGLLLGLALGLTIAWVLAPVRYVNTSPQYLRDDFKAKYRALIALAYLGNPDLTRARARLALLGDPDPALALAVQAQQAQTQGGPAEEVVALRRLAAALGHGSATATWPTPMTPAFPEATSPTPAPIPSLLPPTPTLASAIYTPTPQPTRAASPTPAVSPTPLPFFRVFKREPLCDPAHPGLVRVEVYDTDAQPLPGIAILVIGPQSERVIYTGLQPDLGLGYADFVLKPGETYRVRVQSGSETAEDLRGLVCRGAEGQTYLGGWEVIFMAMP